MSTHEYDYIVVGGGTAGCVLAARLSERPEVPVLLLEAGPDRPEQDAPPPPAWPSLLKSDRDWADVTTSATPTGAEMDYPRGRGIGGSSAINAMNFIRGNRAGYDAWTSDAVTGWAFNDLLPFFRKSETSLSGLDALRGRSGPLHVGPAHERSPLAAAGLKAAIAAGHARAADPSSGVDEGFGWCDLNIDNGRRQDASDAYLEPARRRPNLTVIPSGYVDRLLMDGARCVGVRRQTGNGPQDYLARRETVVTAGAVGSPQLLLASGIGPSDSLAEAGIPLFRHLPGVGQNLHDHPMTGLVYEARQTVPPGVNNHGEVVGLLRSRDRSDGPDIQVMFVDVPLRAPGIDGPEPGAGYTIAVSLMLPESRGSVTLTNVDAIPTIEPGYLTHPRDADALIFGLRQARQIGEAAPLDEWRGKEVQPGASRWNRDDLRRYLNENIKTYSHAGGTCAIGSPLDAVVDSRLRVHGVEGLRIADASVMPGPVSANINATVYAIAEKASAMIKSDTTPKPSHA